MYKIFPDIIHISFILPSMCITGAEGFIHIILKNNKTCIKFPKILYIKKKN